MELIDEKADAYVSGFTTPLNNLLQRIANDTYANHPQSHMLSGHVQGRLLMAFSQMLQPLKVLEVGTFTGFSALCIAMGMKTGGMLHTIELREADAAIAQQYFNESGLAPNISLHLGNALDLIPSLDEQWDLVFIDADKVNYINYYELTLPRLNPGGWIIADNVLFHGEVLETTIKGKNAKAIHAFNQHVQNDERVEQVMLTVRDGLILIKKIQ
jgi:predicted O-methyltransferase YrrM